MTYNKKIYADQEDQFFKFPNLLVKSDLSSSAFRVLCYLARNAENFHPSIGKIAKAIHLADKSVTRALKELRNKKLIDTKDAPTKRKLTRYIFLPFNHFAKSIGENTIESNGSYDRNNHSSMGENTIELREKLPYIKEEQEKTKKRVSLPPHSSLGSNESPTKESLKTDFDEIYALYPRKEEKECCFERYKQEIKTKEDHAKLKVAVVNYAKEKEGADRRYIKKFNNFMDNWKDWAEGDFQEKKEIAWNPKSNKSSLDNLFQTEG